ncbi:hypothetical protein [uncultured Alteromonas sp.]|uniref:hypothetical protein n=1 Tax=uncultured Alteromonas sp. TaxID=179113 RepID=UPI0025E8D942|nr:hypothetical protein [uncultured Alteromonas sp.]
MALYPTNNIAGSNAVQDNVNSVYLTDTRLFDFYKSLHNRPEVTTGELAAKWAELSSQHQRYNTTLLSHEAMTSAFFSAISVPDKLLRIKSVFPDCYIVLIIREPRDWLMSQYTDHPFVPTNLGGGPPCTFDTWVNLFLTEPGLEKAREALNYHQLISRCYGMFGESKVTVLKFDWLRSVPERFCNSWAELFGVSATFVAEHLSQQHENRGLSGIYNKLRQRQRKHILAGLNAPLTSKLWALHQLKSLPKTQYALTASTEALLSDYYAEPTIKLKNLMGW